ncbi:hypothetical protein ANANG_G00092780 [Anguilla anguilla]|uniref:Uncharacterized protein n=1 Tax=Anguilla anguilla TaxID=7936 RepID=A0A9D3S1N7_ANGAN|nr:hypothetical protein ANANG_G00092780 [Anguilla anguilla]
MSRSHLQGFWASFTSFTASRESSTSCDRLRRELLWRSTSQRGGKPWKSFPGRDWMRLCSREMFSSLGSPLKVPSSRPESRLVCRDTSPSSARPPKAPAGTEPIRLRLRTRSRRRVRLLNAPSSRRVSRLSYSQSSRRAMGPKTPAGTPLSRFSKSDIWTRSGRSRKMPRGSRDKRLLERYSFFSFRCEENRRPGRLSIRLSCKESSSRFTRSSKQPGGISPTAFLLSLRNLSSPSPRKVSRERLAMLFWARLTICNCPSRRNASPGTWVRRFPLRSRFCKSPRGESRSGARTSILFLLKVRDLTFPRFRKSSPGRLCSRVPDKPRATRFRVLSNVPASTSAIVESLTTNTERAAAKPSTSAGLREEMLALAM